MNDQLIIPTAEPFLFAAGKTGCVLVHGFTTVPLWYADKIQQGITSVEVERTIIEESGHVISEGIGREKVFESAIQFIKRHGG